MSRSANYSWMLVPLALLAAGTIVLGQTKVKKPIKRAEPPKVEHRPEIFFGDAFKEGLSGPRPTSARWAPKSATSSAKRSRVPCSFSARMTRAR